MTPRNDQVPSRVPRILYSFGFLLLITIVSGLLAESVYIGFRDSGMRERLPAVVVASLPSIIAGAVFAYFVIRVVYRSTLRDFGIRWIDCQRPVWKWLIGASIFAIVVWMAFWGLICIGLSFAGQTSLDNVPTLAEFYDQNPLHILIHKGYHPQVFAYVLHMMVIVGFAEELFGRGLLQNALDRRYLGIIRLGNVSIRTSTLLAALLFAFWHTQWLAGVGALFNSFATSMTIVLVPSLLLAITYERTRSMLVVIILHNVIDGGKLVTWYVWSMILPG